MIITLIVSVIICIIIFIIFISYCFFPLYLDKNYTNMSTLSFQYNDDLTVEFLFYRMYVLCTLYLTLNNNIYFRDFQWSIRTVQRTHTRNQWITIFPILSHRKNNYTHFDFLCSLVRSVFNLILIFTKMNIVILIFFFYNLFKNVFLSFFLSFFLYLFIYVFIYFSHD